MMWNSGTLVPVHSWGMLKCNEGTCASIIQLLHSGFSFWSCLWISLLGSGEKAMSNITLQPWGLERARFYICLMWSQTSSTCGPTWVRSVCVRSHMPRLALLGITPVSWEALCTDWCLTRSEAWREGKGDPWCPQQGVWWGWTSWHPPMWQPFPTIHNKDNFGIVVSFPRENILAALTAPLPGGRKAISKHSLLQEVRDKSHTVGILWKFL